MWDTQMPRPKGKAATVYVFNDERAVQFNGLYEGIEYDYDGSSYAVVKICVPIDRQFLDARDALLPKKCECCGEQR